MDIETKRKEALAAAKAILDKAGTENRSRTEDETKQYNELLAKAEAFKADIEARNALSEIEVIESRSAGRKTNPTPVQNTADPLVLNKKETRSYSVLRAMRLRAAGKELDGIEKEVSDEIQKRSGRPLQSPNGFYMPLQAMDTRALDTTGGAGAVGVQLMPDMIELLRNKLVVASLGATIMTDMDGKFSLPRQSGGATAYWVTEGQAVTPSAATIQQVAFVPKTVGAYTDITRTFMNQSSIDAENFVRGDLAAAVARAIDFAAISGSGSAGQPLGVVNQGITTVAGGTNGSAPSWANIVKLETTVLANNVDTSSLGYLSNSKVAGVLKTTDKTSGGYGQFIVGADGQLNGYKFAVSNAVVSNGTKGTGTNLSTTVFGNWADLVIAMFGAIEINVDPYSLSTSGGLRVVALQDVDIQVRHPESFAVTSDIIA